MGLQTIIPSAFSTTTTNTFFLQAGTDDFRTLSAIYSQLGNAYFYIGDYVKAMQVRFISAFHFIKVDTATGPFYT